MVSMSTSKLPKKRVASFDKDALERCPAANTAFGGCPLLKFAILQTPGR
jgi:hypothetical protein